MTLVMRNPRVTTMLGTVKKLLRTDEDDDERKSSTTVDDASEDSEDDASADSDDDDIYDMVRSLLLEFSAMVAGKR